MMRQGIIIVIGLILTVGSGSAFDIETGRGIGQGRTVSLAASTPTELLRVTSGSLQAGEWSFQTGYSRSYELSELDQLFLAGAYRYRFISAAIGFSQFGENGLYTEKTGRLSLSVGRGPYSIGTMFSGILVEVGEDYEDLNAVTFGFGTSFRSERVMVGVSLDNLNSPRLYETAVPFNPQYNVFAEVIGHASFSLTGRMTLEENQKPQLALGQRIALADRSYFFWGLSTEPLEYGAGVDLSVDRFMFTYALRNHPSLGYSHTISITVGGGAIRKPEGPDEFD